MGRVHRAGGSTLTDGVVGCPDADLATEGRPGDIGGEVVLVAAIQAMGDHHGPAPVVEVHHPDPQARLLRSDLEQLSGAMGLPEPRRSRVKW